ncbi:hypothetical protein [Oerskovia jenensis]
MSTTTTTTTRTAGSTGAVGVGDPDDVREQIEAGVLFANGRLAGRRFASLAEAQAWAHPELGDEVVQFNPVCDCSV